MGVDRLDPCTQGFFPTFSQSDALDLFAYERAFGRANIDGQSSRVNVRTLGIHPADQHICDLKRSDDCALVAAAFFQLPNQVVF